MNTIRTDFEDNQLRDSTTELCSEARQRIWSDKPGFIFKGKYEIYRLSAST
jgi:hypothetical protein